MTKIEALRKTVEALEGGIEYAWICSTSCNCGILAQQILGINNKGLREELNKCINPGFGLPPWAYRAHYYCSQTGIEIPKVFKALFDAGFNDEEILALERLNDPTIIALVGTGHLNKADRSDLIQYLKAWINLLEEQQLPSPAIEVKPEIKPKRVYVTVDAKVRELQENTVLN